MDIFFETQKGLQFCIEIGYFDTVLEIKEKVKKYQGIPVSEQTLVFNGQVLQDDRDVEYCELLHCSHVQLILASDKEDPAQVNIEEATPANNIQLKAPSFDTDATLSMDVNQTTFNPEEMIHAKEQVPVQTSGVESQDDCKLVDSSGIKVNMPSPLPTLTGSGAGARAGKGPVVSDKAADTGSEKLKVMVTPRIKVNRPPPVPTFRGSGAARGAGAGAGKGPNKAADTGSEKLKVMVMPRHGTEKIPVEVNESDEVGELRKELERLQPIMHFHLPEEGYFFIYKQNVMYEDLSFLLHGVNQGDGDHDSTN